MSELDCSKGNCVSCHLVAVLLNIDKKKTKKEKDCAHLHIYSWKAAKNYSHTYSVCAITKKTQDCNFMPPSNYIGSQMCHKWHGVCAEKPIYSSLPVLCNRKGTKSMGHTSHIKLVLWMLTAIRVLGYRDVCVRVCAPVCISISGCTFQCVCEWKWGVKWCHNEFPAGCCLLYASQPPGP